MSNPTSGRWFDTSKVHVLPAFTRRTNPVQYSDLLGPRFVNLDTTLAKMFPIKERVKFELRMEAYNAAQFFQRRQPGAEPYGRHFRADHRPEAGRFRTPDAIHGAYHLLGMCFR